MASGVIYIIPQHRTDHRWHAGLRKGRRAATPTGPREVTQVPTDRDTAAENTKKEHHDRQEELHAV